MSELQQTQIMQGLPKERTSVAMLAVLGKTNFAARRYLYTKEADFSAKPFYKIRASDYLWIKIHSGT